MLRSPIPSVPPLASASPPPKPKRVSAGAPPKKTAHPKKASLRERVREAALAEHIAFMEAIWKDSSGNPIQPGEIHRVIWDFLDRAAAKGIPALVLAPRGVGKTETLLGFTLRRLSQRPHLRYQIVSDNDEHAQDRVGAIKHYIQKDKDFRWLFPEVALDRTKRGRSTLSKFRLTANKYSKDPSLEAAGVFSSGTGSRADEQGYDDLCTEKNTLLEPGSRDRVKRTFFKTWLNILVPGGWWFYIGTLYHEDDLTHAILNNKAVAHLKIGLSEDFTCYDAEEFWPGDEVAKEYTIPLWEPYWSEARYRERYEQMMALGEASAFLASFRNILVDPETAAFRPEWFNLPPEVREQVYKGETQVTKRYKYRVLYADPATSKKKEACFYAGVVLGWDEDIERAVVLHAWRVREGLSQRVDRFLDAVDEYEPQIIAVEGQHDESFAERIEERAVERAMSIKLRRHTHGQDDKVARISGIGPLIEKHRLLVNTERWPFFIKEATVFPNGKMDALDALEGAWHFLKKTLKSLGYVPKYLHVRGQAERARLGPPRYRFTQTPDAMRRSQASSLPSRLAEAFR